MSRIQPVMSALLAQKRKALIPYVTAGFPFADITPALMHGMVAGGHIRNQRLALLRQQSAHHGLNTTHDLKPITCSVPAGPPLTPWPWQEGRQ